MWFWRSNAITRKNSSKRRRRRLRKTPKTRKRPKTTAASNETRGAPPSPWPPTLNERRTGTCNIRKNWLALPLPFHNKWVLLIRILIGSGRWFIIVNHYASTAWNNKKRGYRWNIYFWVIRFVLDERLFRETDPEFSLSLTTFPLIFVHSFNSFISH